MNENTVPMVQCPVCKMCYESDESECPECAPENDDAAGENELQDSLF